MKIIRTLLLVSSMLVQIAHARDFMNTNQCIELCRVFELGTPIGTPIRVHGGLFNLMWRVDTDKGSYAIKQISQDVDLADENIRKNYELTEQIAAAFGKQGLSVVSACKHEGKSLVIIDGIGFMIYPWVIGKMLITKDVSELHILKMAEVFATMHRSNLQLSEIDFLESPLFTTHSNEEMSDLFRKAKAHGCSVSDVLQEHEQDILMMNDAVHKAVPVLQQTTVVAHADLDPKNVLWDEHNTPFLIDWECARRVNPTWDIISVSFDWSRLDSHFNEKFFIAMLCAYQQTGGIINKDHLEAAYSYTIGNWIHWMVYNIKRSGSPEGSEEQKMGVEQVNLALSTILQLKAMKPHLMNKMMKELS